MDAPTRHRRSTSFEDHPAYRQLVTDRMFAAQLGLHDPYYRTHEGRAGAATTIGGRRFINFASYDYLGLNGHPEVLDAMMKAGSEYGTSVSGSRLSSGERPVHAALEQALAKVYEAEAGVVFVSGHATAGSLIEALLGPKDLLLHDALIHNCVVVGGGRCARRSFRHNDLSDLESYLKLNRHKFERVLIVTEGLFSMDGDGPDLAGLIDLKDRFDSWLMVDEAHSLGVLGKAGLGIHEHFAINPAHVDIWFGTLSKTLVGCGGYVCGSRALIDILRMRAPGLVYSVGMPAPTAAASTKALEIMLREPERVERLRFNGRRFLERARAAGLEVGTSWGFGVTPIIVGDDIRTLMAARALEDLGVHAFPVVPPGVPGGTSRLRFFMSAAHLEPQIDASIEAVATVIQAIS